MNRVRLHTALNLTLLLLALVASPLLAAASQQGEIQPTCGVKTGEAAQMMNLLMPPARDAATPTPDFTLHYIGQCCTNNDASLCPTIPGYNTVNCAFPMCGAGQLSCVYQ